MKLEKRRPADDCSLPVATELSLRRGRASLRQVRCQGLLKRQCCCKMPVFRVKTGASAPFRIGGTTPADGRIARFLGKRRSIARQVASEILAVFSLVRKTPIRV